VLHPDPILIVLLLLGVANGTPILATRILGARGAIPIDCGLMLSDGRPVFGRSKTARGIVCSVLATALAGLVVGVGAPTGAALAAASMAGDLFASFCKRRLGLPPHAQALGLDQIPEALLPMLLVPLGLGAADTGVALVAFVVLELLLSRLLFRLRIRDRPY
jgi:CDP-2,3-bis-(O-geranylgeranyl)-sn-glycerol synthase